MMVIKIKLSIPNTLNLRVINNESQCCSENAFQIKHMSGAQIGRPNNRQSWEKKLLFQSSRDKALARRGLWHSIINKAGTTHELQAVRAGCLLPSVNHGMALPVRRGDLARCVAHEPLGLRRPRHPGAGTRMASCPPPHRDDLQHRREVRVRRPRRGARPTPATARRRRRSPLPLEQDGSEMATTRSRRVDGTVRASCVHCFVGGVIHKPYKPCRRRCRPSSTSSRKLKRGSRTRCAPSTGAAATRPAPKLLLASPGVHAADSCVEADRSLCRPLRWCG
jgi:hypothetical protein